MVAGLVSERRDERVDDDAVRLPRGRYAQLLFCLPQQFGGLTTSSLQRSKAFFRVAGTVAPVITLDFDPDLDRTRAALRERGDLIDQVDIVNLHEYLWEDRPCRGRPPGDGIAALIDRVARRFTSTVEYAASTGLPVRTVWAGIGPPTSPARIDYHRPDGSVYLTEVLRRPLMEPDSARYVVIRRDRRGAPTDVFRSRRQLYRRFLVEYAAGEPLFLVIDSKVAPRMVGDLRHQNVYLFPVVHNLHVRPPRHYHSALARNRRYFFKKFDRFDGLVILTDRQAADVVARFGSRSNLAVVPHAVRELPELPAQREPHTCAMLARLKGAKRIEDAIRAYRRVVDEIPTARLEIYGAGEEDERLRTLIAELGLEDAVILMGFRPDARRRLGQVAALLLTSKFEGQPLAVLESFANGCPVIAYDIKYGPADMIDDGRHGYLVPEGDVELLADRIVAVLHDPELQGRLSRQARERAEREFGEADLVRRWAGVFTRAIEQRPRMTNLSDVSVSLDASVSLSALEQGGCGPVRLKGSLAVSGWTPEAARDDHRLSARLYVPRTRAFSEIPVDSVLSPPDRLRFDCVIDLERVCRDLGEPLGAELELTLMLVWNNSAVELPLRSSIREVAGPPAQRRSGDLIPRPEPVSSVS